MLIETGRNLERAGADFLLLPCNTAHFFHSEIQAELGIPLLHMIRLSAEHIKENYPEVRRVGLQASDGTIASKLYHEAYGEYGVEVITPGADSQVDVMDAIYRDIKTGDLENGGKLLHRIAVELIEEGSEALICGCTEVSLVLHDGDVPVPVVDPLQVLAEEAVKLASG